MSRTFMIAPTPSWGGWVVVGLAALAGVAAAAAVARGVLAGRRATFEVSPSGLTLRGDWWGRTLARSDLLVDEARIVDLEREPELLPRRRTLGTALPGYAGGWFRLAGGQKALLYLTDRKRAVWLPTALGFGVLLSPRDPQGFLAALQRGGKRGIFRR